MYMKKIIAGTSAIALSLSMTSVALAATDSNTINLEVEVQETLSFDCYDFGQPTGDTTVTLGTTSAPGIVTAGIPAVGKSTCVATTNDDAGYYVTIEKTTENVAWADPGGIGSGITTGSTVLTHEDPNINGTWYDISDLTAFDPTANTHAGNAATWTDGTTMGLGFSVVTDPGDGNATNILSDSWVLTGTTCLDGEDVGTDVGVYAGVPEDAVAIAANTEYSATQTQMDICYKVDVPPAQQSGNYGGQVTFTATTDASTYL